MDTAQIKDKPLLELSGSDGNAFAILAKASSVASIWNRKCEEDDKIDWEAVKSEATSGDYDHLLQTMMKHFYVE
jgi:hypothetical protein